MHKEQTGEKYKPKKRPVVIQPGDDDCGEDDNSILEDTGEVFHYSDVPPPPNPYTVRQIKNFLTYLKETTILPADCLALEPPTYVLSTNRSLTA